MLRIVDDVVPRLFAGVHGVLRPDRGQTLAEYSLIVTVVAVGTTAAALIIFRGVISGAFDAVTTCLISGC